LIHLESLWEFALWIWYQTAKHHPLLPARKHRQRHMYGRCKTAWRQRDLMIWSMNSDCKHPVSTNQPHRYGVTTQCFGDCLHLHHQGVWCGSVMSAYCTCSLCGHKCDTPHMGCWQWRWTQPPKHWILTPYWYSWSPDRTSIQQTLIDLTSRNK
jgi:hypothetical protein